MIREGILERDPHSHLSQSLLMLLRPPTVPHRPVECPRLRNMRIVDGVLELAWGRSGEGQGQRRTLQRGKLVKQEG